MHGTKYQECSSYVLGFGVPDSISMVHQSSSNVCDPLLTNPSRFWPDVVHTCSKWSLGRYDKPVAILTRRCAHLFQVKPRTLWCCNITGLSQVISCLSWNPGVISTVRGAVRGDVGEIFTFTYDSWDSPVPHWYRFSIYFRWYCTATDPTRHLHCSRGRSSLAFCYFYLNPKIEGWDIELNN
jgi:hypothetical protein